MSPLIFAILLIIFAALLCLLLSFNERSAVLVVADFSSGQLHLPALIALAGTILGLLAIVPSCAIALFRDTLPGCGEFMRAWFLLPIICVGILSALHSIAYLDKSFSPLRRGVYWFFFNMTVAMMLLVTQAEHPVIFLLAWEGMGLFSFALIMFDYKQKENMHAAWIYFLACQAGGALLMLMFFAGAFPLFVFICGMLGFGLKAGAPILHIWLPGSYQAAPAPASVLLSAGMINLGFLGILRWLVLPDPALAPLLGYSLLICGMPGALLGIFFAMPQKNLKRLLAYSSVENMGLIACGLGFGFLSIHWQRADMALLSFAAAGLHLLGHSLLKGNLFLLTDHVYRASGELNLDKLGGMQKILPGTGYAYTLSAMAISGLPPGNIFMAEILLYVAAARGIASDKLSVVAPSLALFLTLAFCGVLAMTVFSKASAAIFLGEPRSKAARRNLAVPPLMKRCGIAFMVLLLIFLCGSPFLAPRLMHAFVGQYESLYSADLGAELYASALDARRLLGLVLSCVLLVGMLFILLWRVRRKYLPYSTAVPPRRFTWDCGFARPTARMQYTGTAFVQPLVELFAPLLRPVKKILLPRGLFPKKASYELSCHDGSEQIFWRPLVNFTVRLAIFSHRLQSGHLHLYVLMLISALLALFIWGFAM